LRVIRTGANIGRPRRRAAVDRSDECGFARGRAGNKDSGPEPAEGAAQRPRINDDPVNGDLPVTMKQTWRQHAACRGLDPLIFYPATEEEAEHAKDVCDSCLVREACLEHALAVREKEGVWGGATERERRRIIRQRRRAS
jgi:WhiB family transcriptional regulator, redox-sensing transcriptional regulator